jgi:hypothetical protein
MLSHSMLMLYVKVSFGQQVFVLGLKTSVLPTSIWHSQMCQ